jgi:F-type H+-transporting ATPase subunit epsilon
MADAPVNATFQFELVSPEKILVSEEVKMVVVPGEEGDFGVLAQHAPLLSSIRPGVVSVTTLTGEVRRIFVAGGFADVSPSLLSVLAEEAVNVSDLDKGALEQSLKNLEDDLSFAKDDPAKSALLSSQIDITKEKIKAAA